MTRSTMLLPKQCRTARRALGWDLRKLAAAAGVSADAVARLERGEMLKPRFIESVQRALEAAGMEFTSGDPAGVRRKVIWYVERWPKYGRAPRRQVKLPAFNAVVALALESRAAGEIVRVKAPHNASTDELDHLYKLGVRWL